MSQHLEAGDIRPTPFADALGERYLSYALSTIMSRSLPDVRDGLNIDSGLPKINKERFKQGIYY